MKKIRYVFIMLIVGFFSCGQGINSTLQPDNPATEENTTIDVSYSTYKHYVDEGVLGEGVSYDVWKTLVEESHRLEKIISNRHEFEKVYSSKDETLWSDFTPKRGDVFVTNGTSSAGFLGHAGIATSSTSILHIAGPGYYPNQIALSSWNSKYTSKDEKSWTKVYRHKDRSIANEAASWAEDTYDGSATLYMITSSLVSTDVTYCSKIVWQAYYFGPSTCDANGPPIGIVCPFDLSERIDNLNLEHIYYKEDL